MEHVSINTPAAPEPLPELKELKEPEPPRKNYFSPAALSFVSGGQVICVGDTDRKSQTENVKVNFTIKHRGRQIPYLGFRVDLKRDPTTTHLYDDIAFHTMLFKYHHNTFDILHRKANENDKDSFLSLIHSDVGAHRAVTNDKLYVIKLFSRGSRGVEITGHESSFNGSDPLVNDIYNHLSSIGEANFVTLWLYEYKNLAYHIEWVLENQAAVGDYKW